MTTPQPRCKGQGTFKHRNIVCSKGLWTKEHNTPSTTQDRETWQNNPWVGGFTPIVIPSKKTESSVDILFFKSISKKSKYRWEPLAGYLVPRIYPVVEWDIEWVVAENIERIQFTQARSSSARRDEDIAGWGIESWSWKENNGYRQDTLS